MNAMGWSLIAGVITYSKKNCNANNPPIAYYSVFTNFTESFSLNSSKTTKHMVIKLRMRQS